MNRRTIVGIQERGDGTLDVRLVRAQGGAAQTPQRLQIDPEQLLPWKQQPGAVKEHGRLLRQGLELSHEEIKKALENLQATQVHERHSLYFLIVGDEAERLSWETLCDDQGTFLALDPRWPIARMADSGQDHDEKPRAFSPPLRVMALLSALGRDATPQWTRLYKAVEKARQDGLEIVVTAVVGQEDLHDTLHAEIQNGTLKDVELFSMPDKPEKVRNLMRDAKPHILHFFCHGSASVGEPRLDLATFDDAGSDKSTLGIEIRTLMGFPAMADVWLVTLNCCEGGKAVEMSSMAYTLVADGGVPVAVGMMEPIDVTDAHEFCGAFYPAVFDLLSETLKATPPGGISEVPWTQALQPPRSVLSNFRPPATDNRQWTLPVFYMQIPRFQIQKAVALPPAVLQQLENMRKRAETVAAFLKSQPINTPLDVRKEALAILNDIPAEMRPDLFGNFPNAGG